MQGRCRTYFHEWLLGLSCNERVCYILQRHLELTSQSEKGSSKSAKKSQLQELSAQLMAVQLRETSLVAQVTELKQETLQLETAVSCSTELYVSLIVLHLLRVDLHWLDVVDRVWYKLAVTVYQCLDNKVPKYLADCCVTVSDIAGRQ